MINGVYRNLIHDFVVDELNHFGFNALVPREKEKQYDAKETVAREVNYLRTVRNYISTVRRYRTTLS
jgi:hypothetical protein